jgi:hypothetical protein
MAQFGRTFNMFEPAIYRICIQGELDQRWFDYFGTHSVAVETDQAGRRLTTFISEPIDQGALVGLITRLNALGIALISVTAAQESDELTSIRTS